MLEYFNVWYENYYKPGIRSTDKKKIKTATKSIYKFKHTLHHNDPSYGVIVRACGKETADAYFHLEYGDYPALTPPKKFKTDFKIWENKKLGIKWTKDAQEKVMEAPQLVQLLIRKTIESRVFEARIELITDEIFEQFKSNRPV